MITRSVVARVPRQCVTKRQIRPATFHAIRLNSTQIHNAVPKSAEGKAKFSTTTEVAEAAPAVDAALVGARYKLTGEVILSKVFWAGFGWQGSSVIAENMGYSAEGAKFALTTGTGEALAVFAGHSAFYMILKGGKPSAELSTGLWLGTGTFFSGTAWQPVVNALVTLSNNNFPITAAGTMVACGSMFYAGLRVGRALWGETMGAAIAARNYENLCSDAGLSVAIGGATAMFVACDPSMVANYFAVPFGVLDADSTLVAMCRAGAATGTGYGLVQVWQNFFPRGRNWMDMYF
eukprot:CAMPEP_0167821786 /NCGR_PEP_ID=MMETSP0112_2-20121227/7034_1 /TAXON_ID=91324 /ORGANISM="Lotharella globosa, Strain CCCM811" /LENGTH=291 /DNA_ID=CAMNT_0007722881 /DNA_START=96 /DNA_END=971 /DNA_ORIENTATION=-